MTLIIFIDFSLHLLTRRLCMAAYLITSSHYLEMRKVGSVKSISIYVSINMNCKKIKYDSPWFILWLKIEIMKAGEIKISGILNKRFTDLEIPERRRARSMMNWFGSLQLYVTVMYYTLHWLVIHFLLLCANVLSFFFFHPFSSSFVCVFCNIFRVCEFVCFVYSYLCVWMT